MLARINTMSAVIAAFSLISAIDASAGGLDPTGVWYNDTGRGAIEIKPCGAGLCGNVVWVKAGADTAGCGRQIIGNAVSDGPNTWGNGWIYSPERKKKYDVELKPLDANRLQVMGYAGSKIFSRTMVWTRAPADLVRCGTEVAKADVDQAKTTTTPSAAVDKTPAPTKAALVAPAPVPAVRPSTEAPREAVAPSNTVVGDAGAEQDSADKDDGSDRGVDVDGLKGKLGEFLKKDGNGNCDLDLPWVKVNFKCSK